MERAALGGIVHGWADDENFWPGAAPCAAGDPFAPASGPEPFLAAQRRPEASATLPARGGTAAGTPCEQLVLDRALQDLDEAAGRDVRGRARGRLDERPREPAARAEYRLIHGELGPDHVLVDADDRVVLIDMEGLMHFDVEWEHVFLRPAGRTRTRGASTSTPRRCGCRCSPAPCVSSTTPAGTS
ncbi:hypothetical protein ACFYXS_22950 [Streptomyces sp. NPDC002574]|uniref:hypothetical protein n=1 Tax=Streptomyces sp. NPDC002574 TaxID=3364652 RepID=UPI0036C6563D